MKRTWARLLLVGAMALLLVQPSAAQPPPPAGGPPPAPGATPVLPEPKGKLLSDPLIEALRSGRILMNYENIDIRVLARLMSELTGKNIVLDERVNGRITVLSSREVTAEEAWEIFKGALERYQFAVQQKHGFYLVVPIVDARKEGHIRLNPPRTLHQDDTTLAVLLLKAGDVAQIQNAIRPLVSDQNNVQIYAQGRAILIADKTSIVTKICELVRQLERSQPATYLSVLLPKYAEAEKLAPMLSTILARATLNPGDSPAPKISAFAPTNALLVQGTAIQVGEAKRIVDSLDIPRATPRSVETPSFYVYFLQYAAAEDTAKVLSEMLGERKAVQGAQQARDPNSLLNSSTPGVPVQQPYDASGTQGYPRLPGDFSSQNAAQPGRIAFVSAKVASDAETNSLILFVSPTEYDDIRGLLGELDVPRRQVLVLAMVAECSLKRVLDQSARLQVAGTSLGVLSTYNAGATEEQLLSFLAGGNFVGGVVGGGSQTINVAGQNVQVPTFFALLSANQSDTDLNLISTPRLLTNDHKEATMSVGDVVPFATGARFDNNSQPLITYDYKEVGIKLKVTPHVSQSNTIRLDIDQQIQEVTDFLHQNLGGLGYVVPLISNRSVQTTAILKEGETLMIGGLISKRTVDVIQKVPFLGDLPLLNIFFQNINKQDQKDTLFVGLTPYIIRSPEEVARLDRPYEEFLHGDMNPSDAQSDTPATQPSKHVVDDPYSEHSATASKIPQDAILLHDLLIEAPEGNDALRQARLVVDNSASQAIELTLVANVRTPDGKSTILRTNPMRLESRESREVLMPPYQFPSEKGTYEFDVAAFVGDDLIARLPLPRLVHVK